MPRWVRVLVLVGAVLVVLLVVMLLTGHGPGQHLHDLSSGTGEPAYIGEAGPGPVQLLVERSV